MKIRENLVLIAGNGSRYWSFFKYLVDSLFPASASCILLKNYFKSLYFVDDLKSKFPSGVVNGQIPYVPMFSPSPIVGEDVC
ncbi:hypothetical protein LEAN103870_17060 [Legionella anisa]|uniref:Nucleotidyl transferase domain-containing protein n=1 Tax=Legionella anisa TaxID=28082 RepID=A0AAX0WXH5_9GAMM|nr:hypothetical protein [Legionella anisa]AWN72482.1 hypothetical protein DLD14_00670 [Legionella anisa]KTC72357.1 hypothetical protein Lani_1277 [Legionella anisa]MCW8423246.1 hypothetical protein [Legionella anisa]MCW8446764.1 hypothetical protein [Legionella anisa]PNL62934.1 hypothetical protein A6J39_017955 [Legionella anisa]